MTLRKAKKILFLSSWYPSDVHQTLGNFVQRHAESVALKNQVTVLYLAKDENRKDKLFIDDQLINQVRTVIVYFKPGLISSFTYRQAFKKGIEYLREKEAFSFDLVHHNVIFNQGWQALYLKNKFNLPYVITEHWTGFHSKQFKIVGARKLLGERVANNSRFILPVSHHLGKAMKKLNYKSKFQVVENVVDTNLFGLSDERKTGKKFIHVSHLGDDHKNISGLMNAFNSALEVEEDLFLHIIGDGDIQPYLQLRSNLGLDENQIKIECERPLEYIAAAMKESDCFLLFSNYENLPCVIIEAFSSGIPVISTDVGGISEIMNLDRGFLIEKEDEVALRNTILEMSQDYAKFDSVSICEYARNEFSQESICDKFNAVYDEII